MDAGNATAMARMQRHVRRRLVAGWAATTIADRLGLTVADVARLARLEHPFDGTPRLVKSS